MSHKLLKGPAYVPLREPSRPVEPLLFANFEQLEMRMFASMLLRESDLPRSEILTNTRYIAEIDRAAAHLRDLPLQLERTKERQLNQMLRRDLLVYGDSLIGIKEGELFLPPTPWRGTAKSRLFEDYYRHVQLGKTYGYDGTSPKETSNDHFHKTIVMAWEKK